MNIDPVSGNYNDPIYFDEDGCYITKSQLNFFLARRKGLSLFTKGSEEFLAYYNKCALYNLISDCMIRDRRSATLYWDSEQEKLSFSFPAAGIVAKKILDLGWDISIFKDNVLWAHIV